MPGQCTAKCVIYQATVTTTTSSETYVGSTFNSFKTRLNDYNTSFKYDKYRKKPRLSNHIWALKDAHTDYTIKWKFLKRAKPYNNITKRCNLCLWEKLYIIRYQELASLNFRSELVSTC